MAIAVSGVTVELREVVLRDKPQELISASAKATVPVLQLPDGKVIEESLDIMHWALQQNDPEHWLAAVNDQLIATNDGPFKHALDRYKYPHRYGLSDGIEHREAALQHLLGLDRLLAAEAFLSGDRRGLTDIALFPFVRQFAATDQAWFDQKPLPALQDWLAALLQSELFESVMQRFPQWKSGDPPTHFP